MVPKIDISAGGARRSRPFDPRLFLLLMISLVIVLAALSVSRPPSHLTSSDQYMLHWNNNSLMLTADEIQIGPVPAHIAPLFFEKININQANSNLLQIIPGIGPGLADRIIVKRNEQGGFNAPEQLLSVSGIGPKRQIKLTAWLSFD